MYTRQSIKPISIPDYAKYKRFIYKKTLITEKRKLQPIVPGYDFKEYDYFVIDDLAYSNPFFIKFIDKNSDIFLKVYIESFERMHYDYNGFFRADFTCDCYDGYLRNVLRDKKKLELVFVNWNGYLEKIKTAFVNKIVFENISFDRYYSNGFFDMDYSNERRIRMSIDVY